MGKELQQPDQFADIFAGLDEMRTDLNKMASQDIETDMAAEIMFAETIDQIRADQTRNSISSAYGYEQNILAA